jgi:hypothetical protein
MAEFIDAVADLLVASGVGARYSTSGTSIQVNYRRDEGAPVVVLLMQQGGLSHPRNYKENYAVQCLVDSTTISGARDTCRQVYDLLHETVATEISGHQVLWLRAIAPPQAIPVGPGGGEHERYHFSVNFDALLVKA